MSILEISKADITSLNDSDLRELVGRLCEAELKSQSMPVSGVFWGGSQTSADDGLDAEVILEVPQSAPDFIPRKHTGFQVKKNSMAKQACFKEMHLGGKLRPIIKKLINEKGAYIIVSGKDDCTRKMLDDRTKKMRTAISALKNHNNLKIDFYGVDRLATWVRKHPSIVLWIRGRLGKPLSGWKGFGRWAATPSSIEDNYLVDEKLLVLDSTISNDNKSSVLDSVNKIRQLLLSPKAAVRITGLSGVGKTRFAQALFEDAVGVGSLNPSQVIYADLGESIEPSATDMLSQLIAQNERMILVLDNCPPDVHRSLQKKLKEAKNQLSLLTIEYDISDDKPEETKVFHLEPASEEIVEKILIIRFPNLGQVNSRIISNFSGGNSRLAIALAERVEAGESLSGFSDEELFQRLFTQRKGNDENLLESAEALSLVYSFNIDTSVGNPELDAIAEISGKTRNELYRASSTLLNRQLIQKRADWRALLPHALANRIAKQALRNIPLNQILLVISSPENKRLLKSFSKRLSYLHDCEEAKKIAQEWLSKRGILGDIQNINSDGIEILNNIAPVNPKATLDILKINADKKGFTTRNNKHFSNLVVLLRKLAYEEQLFNDAVDILVRFAKEEKDNNNYENANKVVSALFRMTLSGTLASPEVRVSYIRALFNKGDEVEKQIALELLNSALQTSHFISHQSFEFGAHPRGTGYRPSTYAEQKEWSRLFMSLALEIILSENEKAELINKLKTILGRHFRGLWNIGMHDELEKITHKIIKAGYWFEGWKGVTDTILYDKNSSSDLIDRLKNLKEYLQPKDIHSEIEAFVFHNIYENLSYNEDTCEDDEKALQHKVINFGKFVANDLTLFGTILKRLFTESTDSLYFFGQGLAEGAKNKNELFGHLLQIVSEVNVDQIDIRLLGGFIEQVQFENAELVDELLGLFLLDSKLRKYFVHMQCYIPINKRGYERILNLASDKTIPTWRFQSLATGRCHESLTDDELAAVIVALNKHESSYLVTLKILQMRFWGNKAESYSDSLLQVSRDTLQNYFQSYSESVYDDTKDYEISKVGKVCLANGALPEEIKKVLESLISAMLNNTMYSFHFPETLQMICEEHTSIVLDIVYKNEDREYALDSIFKENIGRGYPLGLVQSDELIKWCECGEDDRFTFVAKAIFPFSSLTNDTDTNESKSLELNKNALAILEKANNKEEIVKILYQQCMPNQWSGSRYLVVQSRREALKVLNDYPDENIAKLSKMLAKDIERQEQEDRINEMERDSQREQRFE